MRTVAVTGASGYLGRKVLERLGNEADISRVIGIDVREPSFSTRNLEFYRADVRSTELAEIVQGCDAVVHLATNDSTDAEETYDVIVGGTRAVTDAVARAGVVKLVFVSSVAVYGAHPDNDYPLTEHSSVRPSRENAYAVAKAEAEELVEYFAQSHPDVMVTTLRPAWICGPSMPTARAALVDSPLRVAIVGYDAPVQAVHEDDAAGAIAFALANDLRGIYNLCADDWVDRPDELLGQRRVTLEADRARKLLQGGSRLGLSPLVPADIPGLMYPQVMSNEKLRAAGFTCEHSTAEALREAAEARREWVAVGSFHFRPRRVALIAGTFGAVLLGSAVRRRRPKPPET
jgi:nucleoside-diphosphate-sugar epimerase